MQYYFDMAVVPVKSLVEGVTIKVVHGERIMLSFVDFEAGASVPEHIHPHEQMGYVIAGEVEFDINGEKKRCQPGDAYIIPSNIHHTVKVSSDGPAKVLDIFSPPREEFK